MGSLANFLGCGVQRRSCDTDFAGRILHLYDELPEAIDQFIISISYIPDFVFRVNL